MEHLVLDGKVGKSLSLVLMHIQRYAAVMTVDSHPILGHPYVAKFIHFIQSAVPELVRSDICSLLIIKVKICKSILIERHSYN